MRATPPAPTLPAATEYGSPVARANPSRRVTLASKQASICGRVRELSLDSVSPGYVPAGSALRLQSAPAWSVTWSDGRATHGRSFADESAARDYFNGF